MTKSYSLILNLHGCEIKSCRKMITHTRQDKPFDGHYDDGDNNNDNGGSGNDLDDNDKNDDTGDNDDEMMVVVIMTVVTMIMVIVTLVLMKKMKRTKAAHRYEHTKHWSRFLLLDWQSNKCKRGRVIPDSFVQDELIHHPTVIQGNFFLQLLSHLLQPANYSRENFHTIN